MPIKRFPTPEESEELILLANMMKGVMTKTIEDVRASLDAVSHFLDAKGLRADTAEAALVIVPFFLQTLRTAVTVLESGDYGSAGALARKALECMYVLVTIAKRGKAGLDLIEQAGTRQIAGIHQKALRTLPEMKKFGLEDAAPEKEDLIEKIRKVKKIVPNGDISRVEIKTVAEWAGLSTMHKRKYANLNAYAHFDSFHALEAAPVQTGGAFIYARVAQRTLGVALDCSEILLRALEGMRELGFEPANKALQSLTSAWTDANTKTAKLMIRHMQMMKEICQ